MQKLISIVGQTASGKSSLGIFLAQKFDGEIVSADSRQVYVGLDATSGKVTKEEMKLVPHHLIDVAEIGNQFTLFDFQNQAYHAIDEILEKNKIPFMVGGTGLYVNSVVYGYSLDEIKPDFELRRELEIKSLDELKQICAEKNLVLPEEITARRLIRLIEISENKKQENKPKYEVLQIGIDWPKEEIYERIKMRLIDRMPEMIKEVKSMLENGKSPEFLMSLGLDAKYVTKYILGEFHSYDDFFEELFKEERHFAKRQKTWFNKNKDIVWLDAKNDLYENAEELVKDFLNKK